MQAYKFTEILVNNISSSNAEIKICDNKYDEQFFDANVSVVDHSARTVVLAAHLDYDSNDEWINTANLIKEWFLKNNVKPDYTIRFENHDSKEFYYIKAIKPDVFKLI